MRTILFLLLCLGSQSTFAQIGLRVFHEINHENTWRDILRSSPISKESDIFTSSLTVSADYWFRLKNQRLEFLPDISYTRFRDNYNTIEEVSSYSMDAFGVGLNVHLYFLDYLGDCDCPTFSKQGNWFKKGIFLMARPGIAYYDQALSYNVNEYSHSTVGASFGLGIGMDIGLNDLITLTPIMTYTIRPGISWQGFSAAHGFLNLIDSDETSTIGQWQLGIRLGFRPDYQ